MKTILITGSTDGIGKLAAIGLAQEGHDVCIHGRNFEKVSRTADEIRSLTGAAAKGYVADLSRFPDMVAFCEQVMKNLDKVDVLVNNAGVYKSAEELNQDGLDLRFVVNYFAPVVLTDRLLPLLKRSVRPLVINLGSASQAPVSIDALGGKTSIPFKEAYMQSKLALTMWSFHLSRKHPDLSAVALNPGSRLDTRMVQEAYGYHWSPAEKGADIIKEMALTANPQKYDGKYFDNDRGKLGMAHHDAYDDKKIAELMISTNGIIDRLS